MYKLSTFCLVFIFFTVATYSMNDKPRVCCGGIYPELPWDSHKDISAESLPMRSMVVSGNHGFFVQEFIKKKTPSVPPRYFVQLFQRTSDGRWKSSAPGRYCAQLSNDLLEQLRAYMNVYN